MERCTFFGSLKGHECPHKVQTVPGTGGRVGVTENRRARLLPSLTSPTSPDLERVGQKTPRVGSAGASPSRSANARQNVPGTERKLRQNVPGTQGTAIPTGFREHSAFRAATPAPDRE
jgi:hypothetical protein